MIYFMITNAINSLKVRLTNSIYQGDNSSQFTSFILSYPTSVELFSSLKQMLSQIVPLYQMTYRVILLICNDVYR